MTGEQQRNDDPDFLDDDFVIEDLAGKGDDLDQLFQPSADAPKPAAKPPGSAPDEDDVLFHDHSQNVKPSERFQGREAFTEDGKSGWRGEELELDEAHTDAEETQAAELAEAEQSFTEELGSMLQSEEEFGLDSERELELVDAPVGEDAETVVVDEAEAALEQAHAEVVAEAAAAEPALAEDEAPTEPGWEPLPETSVDQLSEVGDVQPVDEGETPPTPEELAEVDGHDLYDAEAEAQPVLVGPRPRTVRTLRLVGALAASLALVGGAAVVVLRPEWVGLALEPIRVDVVKVDRPQVRVAIATPAALPTAPQLGHADPATPTTPADPLAAGPAYGPELPPGWTPPETPTSSGAGSGPIAGVPVPDGTALPTTPVVTSPVVDWPVVAAPKLETGRTPKPAPLVRVGDNVMLGDVVPGSNGPGRAVEGVAPGARAFAQLHNGNYFIGSVKNAADDRVTLRVADGEVTLASEEIARLTQLGTADYDELQRVTSGSIRLRNNNRLVGGILSQIADDHVVLEFRSNRVMLPKSVIGEVKAGADEEVRLDVTREEDDWVRSLAERELGTGTGTTSGSATGAQDPAKAKSPAPKTVPTKTPSVNTATPPATTPAAPAAGSSR